MVTLNVYVELTQFTSTDPNNANRLVRKVSTEALLANKEVLALGGLIQDTKNETTYKVPFLGDIPLLGWLFKNKSTYIERTSLLILIAPEIIKPFEPEVAEAFTLPNSVMQKIRSLKCAILQSYAIQFIDGCLMITR